MLQATNMKAVNASVLADLVEQSTASDVINVGDFAVVEIEHPMHGFLQFIDAGWGEVLIVSPLPDKLKAIN